MLIKNIPEIVDALSSCRLELGYLSDNGEGLKKQISIYNNVDEWRYSKNDFFDPIPFRNEVEGERAPQLLKKKYADPSEASEKGVYSSGFIDGKLVVTRHPTGAAKSQMTLRSFECFAEKKKIVVAGHSVNRNNFSRIIGVGVLFWASQKQLYYAGVGIDDAYHIICFEYLNGRVAKEIAMAGGWNMQVEFFYEYHENGNLKLIKTPSKDASFNIKIWPKTKDWKILTSR